MTSVVVVSASYDKQIRIWDAASGRNIKSFVFPDSQVNSLCLLPDTGYLAVAGFGALRLYDLCSFLHNSGGGARAGVGAGAASNNNSSANQAPAIFSSFESPSSMNFTSMATIPFFRNGGSDDQASALSGSARLLDDSASSVILDDRLLRTVVMADTVELLDSSRREVSFILIATSEDGHIRFFDTRPAVTLRLLKDIATGAAITCSAVSPDNRYLLTGNQMGQVSVWHLPSIVASVALEMKDHPHHKMAASTTASRVSGGSPIAATGGAGTTTVGEPGAVAAAAAEEERAKAFGRKPLQDMNFTNDYSAIRSVAIEPLGRWAAVATNAGKVHFIRLARDASVCGSKADSLSAQCATQREAIGVGANNDAPPTPQEQQAPRASSPTGSMHPSSQNSPVHASVAASAAELPSTRLALTAGAGSKSEGGMVNNNYHGPRETIYRSALAVNELSSNAQRASDASGNGTGPTSSASHSNSMGAALLEHIEQQHHQSACNSCINRPDGHASAAHAAPYDQLGEHHSAAEILSEELEMEVFDTLVAHHKYILRVLISPSSQLLVTCSADYSVGRFLVPAALRVPSSAASSAKSRTSGQRHTAQTATSSHSQPVSRPSSETRNDDQEVTESDVRDCALGPSFASTQEPHPLTSSRIGNSSDYQSRVQQQQQQGELTDSRTGNSASKENATTAVVTGEDNSNTPPRNEALLSTATHSFDDTASPSVDGGIGDESLKQNMVFQPLKPLSGHNRWVWDGVFSDCSNFLFTASSDNTLRMWNGLMTDRPQSVSFVGHTKPVVAVLLCYDKQRPNSA
ncbi:hypothetical protein JKF63_05811 [Porcisia hertigi]|uniref:Guanine nucleotide-binding protein subunit beta-like protein n=1 Tax=Porcisia hertigi TaxID=2761500 RepID=A0A836LFZ1_9TRYP|nr:hypothetical protein JKF63_05811 [Porcisia hertigi]